MKHLFVCCIATLCGAAFALTPVKLNEVFSVEKTPGSGKLTYTQGEKTETIELGGESGHYAMGLVFRSDLLPESVAKDFQAEDIIQVAIGTQRGKVQFQVPQFAAVTLLTKGGYNKKTVYKLSVPNGTPNTEPAIGLLLFTSPQTPTEQSDEEKLKRTYFAQSGKFVATPKGKPELLSVRYQGKTLNFRKFTYSARIEAQLVTPFNSQENSLKGDIEFPVYTAKGKAAEGLIRKIAGESLGGLAPAPTNEAISTHRRDVAGSQK